MGDEGRGERRALGLAWAGAWLVGAALIAIVRYTSPDADSQLYAGIATRLSREGLRGWIAPEWWGLWNSQGLFADHPAGIFILPAALARVGYPAAQASYAIDALYQVLTFVLVEATALAVIGRREARALGWLLQLLPIAFVFRVRANHEYAVLAGTLLALYSTERARSRPRWALGSLAGFSAVLLVKGAIAFIVPIVCAVWLMARAGGPVRRGRPSYAWMAVAMMPIAGALATVVYEAAYVRVTGQSFLDVYTAKQVPNNALVGGLSLARAGYTAIWYAARIIWYAFPWSLAAGAVAIRSVRRGRLWPWSAAHAGTVGAESGNARQGAWFALVASLVLTAAFCLAHRKADRYIFPVYFMVGAVGAVAGMRRFPRLERLTERWFRPWVPPAVYISLVLLRLITAGKLPEFGFWRP